MPTAKLTADLAEANTRIVELEGVLGLSNDNLGVAFRLSTTLNKLLGCLLATPNVTPDTIVARLKIATDAKVAVHRLREVLKPYGITIQSRRGLGYWLEPEDKEKIWAITRAGTSPPALEQAAA